MEEIGGLLSMIRFLDIYVQLVFLLLLFFVFVLSINFYSGLYLDSAYFRLLSNFQLYVFNVLNVFHCEV